MDKIVTTHTKNLVLELLNDVDITSFKSEFNQRLWSGPLSVSFTKADGTTRTMRCTLNPGLIENSLKDSGKVLDEGKKSERTVNPDVKTVWDLDVGNWRSFRWDRLISMSWENGEQE